MTKIKLDEKTGKYYFVYSGGYHPVTGTRIQKKRKGIPTMAKAKELLKQVIVEVEKEKDSHSPIKGTFESYIENWFEAKRVSLRPSTIINYRQQIDYNILPYLGHFKIADISEEVLQAFVNRLHNERNLAGKTIRATFGIVGEVLKKSSRKGAFDVEILREINLPTENKRVEVWSADDIKTFLDARSRILNLTRHFIGMEISVLTGMRCGEVLGLRWSDVDFERKILTIRQTLSKIDDKGNYGLVPEAKTINAFRTVNLPNHLVASLIAHKRMIDHERRVLGDKYADNDLVVCAKNGSWVHPNNFRRAFNVTRDGLGLPKIPLKGLRHTHATYLVSIRVNPKVVQERLGHANIKTTLGTYSHVLPSMQREVAEKLDRLVAECDRSVTG
ncbi:site-specific integrase [Bacillus amyloliquefaciens]|uniref:site-specific integrase n=1 Tax=Bacillus amyloliquefaciens TaxID=1390 RepID=UPI002670BB78|nr:site-specific integrase [Bacillus amyloliquefaciens]WKT37509.1 site-specific integrase [Bacillus amyloliquefaciens]WKT37600.1 site-specific integrase [Bacillus amyloliquefaciens]